MAGKSCYWDAQCHQLAKWWLEFAVDDQQGGFFGEITYDNRAVKDAEKCIILNARILWFFSRAAQRYAVPEYGDAATRAYTYLCEYFCDHENGGFFWSVDARGRLRDSRKHIYAQAFSIYALSAYFEFSNNASARSLAVATFQLLERHAKDSVHGGYFESFTRNWQKNSDVRLSEKEDNWPKTMNTHLHILEAYTALLPAVHACEIAPRVSLALQEVLKVFCEQIVDSSSHSVKMFMADDWSDKSESFSFGHDIEASWLVHKALGVLGNGAFNARYRPLALRLAERVLIYGLTESGRVRDEVKRVSNAESCTAWWVQFEAMVGFAWHWRLSGSVASREAVEAIWRYTLNEYQDVDYGEWHWFAKSDLDFELSKYKVGAWKAPYHTGRAFLELSALGTDNDNEK